MSQSFHKDKLLKDYYRCSQIEHLNKKDGSPYLRMCLINKKGILNGYLWSMVDFYVNEISEDKIYAIKAKEESYKDEAILNIHNIKPVINNRYDKYGYILDRVSISNKRISEFHYDRLLELMSSYSDKTIEIILDFYVNNKNKIIESRLLEHKQICIKHAAVLFNSYSSKIDKKLCIILILIDRLSIDSFIDKVKGVNAQYYNLIKLYMINDKEFIKKYKYIVDLIHYNFSNESFFKTN